LPPVDKPAVIMLRLGGYPGELLQHYHLIPGLGDMDFTAILQALKRQKYDGYLTVELYTYPDAPDEAARMSLSYLRKLSFRSAKEKELCA